MFMHRHTPRLNDWPKMLAVLLFCLMNIPVQAVGNTDAVLDVILEVPESVIYWDGEMVGAGNRTLMKPPGDYELTVVLPDGSRQVVKVTLAPGEIRQLNVAAPLPPVTVQDKPLTEVVVQRRTGSLLVVGPRPDLPVRLDGRPIGKSSLFVQGLASGEYQLQIADERLEITIQPERVTVVRNGEAELLDDEGAVVVYDWLGPDSLSLSEGETPYGKVPITVGPLAAQVRQWQLSGTGVRDEAVETAAEGHVVRRLVAQLEKLDPPQELTPAFATATVARAYGTLAVADAGRQVNLDNRDIGLSPVIVTQVLAGVRNVTIGDHFAEIEIHPDHITQVRVGPEGIESVVIGDMPSLAVIGGDVPGMEIRLAPDQDWSPLTAHHLIEGEVEQTVHLRGPGYQDAAIQIHPSPEKTERVRLVAEENAEHQLVVAEQGTQTLSRAYGRLVVVDAGNAVWLDGKAVGDSPVILSQVLTGTRQVSVGEHVAEIEVHPDRITQVQVGPEGIASSEVGDIPALAVIGGDIPGMEIRLAPDLDWIPLAAHHLIEGVSEQVVSFRGVGYEPQEYTITPDAERPSRINLVMAALEPPRPVDVAQTTLIAARAYGQLLIATAAPRMPVVLDGVAVGVTTFQVETVLAGERNLQIGQYAPRKVEVHPNKWTVVRIDQDGEWAVMVGVSPDELTLQVPQVRADTEQEDE